jgi:hypothetical protein
MFDCAPGIKLLQSAHIREDVLTCLTYGMTWRRMIGESRLAEPLSRHRAAHMVVHRTPMPKENRADPHLMLMMGSQMTNLKTADPSDCSSLNDARASDHAINSDAE